MNHDAPRRSEDANHPTRWGWGDWSCVTSRLGSPPVGKAENPLSQGQTQPLSLWSPPAGVLCLCQQLVLCLCRPAPVEGAEVAGAVSYRPRVLVPRFQQSSPTGLSPPDKCPSGSEPRPSRQRRLKFVSSKPPWYHFTAIYDARDSAKKSQRAATCDISTSLSMSGGGTSIATLSARRRSPKW